VSTAEREFTASRENGFQDILEKFGLPIAAAAQRNRHPLSYSEQRHVQEARERDRDDRTRLIMWWRGDFTPAFERHGRHFVRQLALDALAQMVGADRGDALTAKPDEKLRRKIARFKRIQGAREAAYEAAGKDLEHSKGDAPLRAALGGLQDFTPGRENTHKRPKGYAPWRPHKKTTRLIFQVQEVLEEYRNYLPMTARQIFYRLVGVYGYPKTEAKYDSLTEVLVRARRAKMIPFEHIRDDGISVVDHAHYADENDFIRHIHEEGKAYKRDKLARQKIDMRVYCEAAGMMPQLERVCEPFSIPVYSCSGFDSLSGKYELKEACWRAYTHRGRRTVILHLGDYDPSGESIFNDGLVEDIHAFLAEDVSHKEPHEVAAFERVALTAEQVETFNLPTEPPKATDSRTKNWQGEAACQLEALPPDVLAGLLDATIKTHLNLAVYEQDLQAEEEERRRITKALPAVGGSS
jgi:hypothetical protein